MTIAQVNAAAFGDIPVTSNIADEKTQQQAPRILTQYEVSAVAGGPETTVGTGYQPPVQKA